MRARTTQHIAATAEIVRRKRVSYFGNIESIHCSTSIFAGGWSLIAQHPFVDLTCPPARARRNFQRLLRRHPEVGAKLGLSELSVYKPF
jgi:hypothetical protein